MPKVTRRNTAKNPYPSIKAINSTISESFKNSNIPVLQELAKIPNFMEAYMSNAPYYVALLGNCYVQFYSAIVDAIKAEVAVMAKGTMTAQKAIYPGVWSDHLMMSLAEKLMLLGATAVDDPKGGWYIVVETIDAELAHKDTKGMGYLTTEYLQSRPENEVMKFTDYTDERFNQILVMLTTAVVSRCMLLSADRYPALITTADSPSQPIRIAEQFNKTIIPKITDWFDNVYVTIDDGHMKEEVDSFVQCNINEILSFVCTLAQHGGLNNTLIDAVLANSSITPMCNCEGFDGLADPKFKITFLLTYKTVKETPVTATFELLPVKIFNLFTNDKVTVSMKRDLGRMLRDAMTAYVRYCIAVLADDPEVINTYVASLPKPESDPLPDGADTGITFDEAQGDNEGGDPPSGDGQECTSPNGDGQE